MFDVPQKFYELCRLCLSPDGAKLSIFEEEGTQRNFAEKILTCLSIAVSVVVCNPTRFIGRDHLCYSRRLCVCVSLSASFLQCRAFSLSLSRLLAHSLALSLVCRSFVRSFVRSEALSRALPRDSVSRSFSPSLSGPLAFAFAITLALVNRVSASVYMCACHGRKFGKRCVREISRRAAAAFKMAVISPART